MAYVLTAPEWKQKQADHNARLNPVVGPHLARASRREAHPIHDFLFQYYRFSPAQLTTWSPGWGVGLTGQADEAFPPIKQGCYGEGVWRLDPSRFPTARLASVVWVRDLQRCIAERPPRFGCFGLHEWAMVYRARERRHSGLPLRLTAGETDRVVESMPVVCSHYDAFRFFTNEARPLNRIQPDLASRDFNEQSGCLHVNMDLYKWSSMFYPWVSSDLIADSFLLAVAVREVDMRASPYDVRVMDREPVRIETEEGRETYRQLQKGFAEQAAPLRTRLIDELSGLIDYFGTGS